jgi:NIMA-interacting peptidyl-prolyl cis-trans isomerase 1
MNAATATNENMEAANAFAAALPDASEIEAAVAAAKAAAAGTTVTKNSSSASATNEAPENNTAESSSNNNKRPLEEEKMESPAETMPSTQPASPPQSSSSSNKRQKKSTSSSSGPKEVRVLHILKKHKDSRRPSSWRQKTITSTVDEAKKELQDLLDVLNESKDNPEELRATFNELARTESDCSSAKRGGDLGFFGRRKMQPAFEEASFGLDIGELSNIIETSSGVHVILRIG